MTTRTHHSTPHDGAPAAAARPKDGQSANRGASPDDREPGTRPDGEAMPPKAADPAPDGKGDAIPPLPEPDVEGVGKEDGTEIP
jgi:hypothetical protein